MKAFIKNDDLFLVSVSLITACIVIFSLTTSCAALPALFTAVEDIADDEAVQVKISREAINKGTDITIALDVKNSQQK
jgi:hypothetical protein